MNRTQKKLAVRKAFEEEYSDDELINELCDTIVSLIYNHSDEKRWFETVVFKEGK